MTIPLTGSAEEFIHLLPRRPIQSIGLLFSDKSLHIHLALTREQIHISGPNNLCPDECFVPHIHYNDDRCGEIRLEEVDDQLSCRFLAEPDGAESRPKLRNQHKNVEDHADPRSPDAHRRPKREFVQCVALEGPGFAKPDVCQANAAPGEDRTQPR